jgi:O-methyltransferase involved in polyketide biosynthesis
MRTLVGVDTTKPSVARVYDYFLGGKDNYAADRQVAEQVIADAPYVPRLAVANRTFLGRVVRFLADEAGIAQFLDIGSGLPTRQNVHQVVQSVNPDARVLYVDNDPIVLCHAHALLATNGNTRVIAGDLRDPDGIIDQAGTFLDLSRPVAVLLFAVLHFFPSGGEHDPYRIVGGLLDTAATGSYVAISHVEPTLRMVSASRHYTAAQVAFRTRQQVLPFFDGTALVPPGLVSLHQWRPIHIDPVFPEDDAREPVWVSGGVGRKP